MVYAIENLVIKRNNDRNILKICEIIAASEYRQQFIKNKNDSILHSLVLWEVQNETAAWHIEKDQLYSIYLEML